MSQRICDSFAQLDHIYDVGDIVRVCSRCFSNISASTFKIPAQALANKMELDNIPTVLSCLTPTELRLISQVKLYIKIHLLTRYGQNAVKGVAVRFPQDAHEVVEQLPPDASNIPT